MTKNLNTALKRRKRNSCAMQEFDALPPELRMWLHSAQLPWSARSVLRLWNKALKETQGAPDLALAQLTAQETRLIKKDAPRVWGASYPV